VYNSYKLNSASLPLLCQCQWHKEVIFPAFLILRYKYAHVRRTYQVPGGMVGAWIVTLLPLAYAVIASWFILFPTDHVVTSFKVTRLTYELSQLIPLGIIVLLTIMFYIWSQSEKRDQDVVVELNTQMSAGFGAGAGGE
jgi:glutamate:GABA antiporter